MMATSNALPYRHIRRAAYRHLSVPNQLFYLNYSPEGYWFSNNHRVTPYPLSPSEWRAVCTLFSFAFGGPIPPPYWQLLLTRTAS